MGFGITQELIEAVLLDYIKDNDIPNPFNRGVPGKDCGGKALLGAGQYLVNESPNTLV